MRVRLTLVAVALAVLALAGSRDFDRFQVSPQDASPASSQLTARPAPEPALPAVLGVAATRSISVQAPPHLGWRRDLRPAPAISLAGPASPVDSNDDVTRPLSFPLLI